MPPEIYVNKSGGNQIIDESPVYWTIDKMTFNDGIKQWVTGAEYPCKGNTPPEALFACNQAKRLFIEGIRVLGVWSLLIGWRKLLKAYIDISWKIMSPYILKYEYMTEVGQEIQDITQNFLEQLDVPKDQATQFAQIFSHLIEYDNAYRYRVEDIMSESRQKDFIRNPRKEIKRLMNILSRRDSPGVADKFVSIAKLLSLTLLVPVIKKTLRSVLEYSNWEKLQADKIDRYWMSMRKDYKFEGLTNEERKAKYSKLKMPKAIKR